MKNDEKKEITKTAKLLSKWFQVEITIRVLDEIIINWIFPPKRKEQI